jgi:hypothetical protein
MPSSPHHRHLQIDNSTMDGGEKLTKGMQETEKRANKMIGRNTRDGGAMVDGRRRLTRRRSPELSPTTPPLICQGISTMVKMKGQ